MKKTTYIIIALAILSQSCTRKEDVVAYVGHQKITVSEFKRRINELPEYYLGFISTEGGKKQYLSGMIKEELLLIKGEELKLDKSSDVLQRLKDLKRELLLTSVINYLQNQSVQISDQEVRDFYEENKAEFKNPEQIKVSHILLSDEKNAQEVMAKIKQGNSFESLAREYSIDTVTAINGGDLGYFGKGEMLQPEFEKEVFSLKKIGSVSEIIKTPFGYHVAKLTGRRRGREKTFEESKELIRANLEKQKFNQLIEDYRQIYNVRVNYDVLENVNIEENKEGQINEN